MNRWQQALAQQWEQLRDRVAASELGQRAWAYYETSTPREQQVLKILAVFLAAVAALLLVIQPLHRFHSEAQADYLAQRETVAWMEANRGNVAKAPAPATARQPDQSLLTLANQSARRFGLSFRRSEPNGENGLNLWLERVPFNRVVQWLGALEREYGVIAADIAASRGDEPGMVDVRIVLEG